jgi:hypothetical protein
MTTAHDQLSAVAAGLSGHGISIRLTRLGDTPVLTIEEPAAGPDPTTVSVDPDPGDPGLPVECTCIWTPAPGATPQAIADTIITVLNAVRPLAAGPGGSRARTPATVRLTR